MTLLFLLVNKYTVKKFIEIASKKLNMKLKWKGKGINEKAYDSKGKMIIKMYTKIF